MCESDSKRGETRTGDDLRLQLLILDYQMVREDERTFVSTQATIISIAVPLLLGLAAVVSQACQFAGPDQENCSNAPELLLACAPFAPAAVLAFLQMQASIATARSYYTRALEAELRRFNSEPFAGLGGLTPGSYVDLTMEIASLRRGRPTSRILGALLLLTILVEFGGLTLYIALHLSVGVRVGMFIVYGGAVGLFMVEAYLGTLGGRGMFVALVKSYVSRREAEAVSLPVEGPEERSLLSYLLLPRPEDWIKWTIVAVTYGLAVWSFGFGGSAQLVRMVVIWFVLEYLIQEARYQWNDIRGLAHDSVHLERRSRARLPHGVTHEDARRNISVSMWVAASRIGLAVLVGWVAGEVLSVLILIAGVFAISLPYEWIRSRPAAHSPLRRTPTVLAIWLLVGLGYGLRGGAGLWLGGAPWSGTIVLLGATTLAAFGVMFVSMTWVLEAMSYCRRTPAGYAFSRELGSKNHLGALLTFVSVRPNAASKNTIGESCGDETVLERRGQVLAPWNGGLAIAATFGGMLAAMLASPASAESRLLVALTTISVLGAVALVFCRSTTQRWITVVMGGVLVMGVGVLLGAHNPVIAAVVWLIIGGCYAWFRAQSYRDLKKGIEPALLGLRNSRRLLLRWVVGRETWAEARFDPPRGAGRRSS